MEYCDMSLTTIMVCLTTEEHSGELLAAAVLLARKHDAHLIGTHVMEALMVYPGIAMHLPGPALSTYHSSQMRRAELIEKLFRESTRNENFASEWRLVKTQTATAAERLVEFARTADLVIAAQEDRKSDQFDQHQLLDRMIRNTGRPVLMIPRGYKVEDIGHSALIGWSATREAARAAHDALDVIDLDAEVLILRINSDDTDDLQDHASNELAVMFDRHGRKATTIHKDSGWQGVSSVLNNEALRAGADMIVTGAFGHSRTYDFVIGTVTNDLLRQAELPVLFSK
jgi:nucleotide-binding universal stress UspA family protein